MKQIILLVLLLNSRGVVGQNMLLLPKNPEAGKYYKQCLKYDSTVVNPDPYAVIPPLGWEEVRQGHKTFFIILEKLLILLADLSKMPFLC
jgi:hypothetical protein